MLRYVARRLVLLLPVWLGISLLAFGLTALTPGDPAAIMLQRQTGEAPSAADVRELRRRLHLDDPLPARYGRWLWHAVRGDLGRSFRTGEPVLEGLARRFPYTLAVALLAMAVALALALPLGVLAAVRHRSRLDRLTRVGALLLGSMPAFWLGYLLILLFAVRLRLLPVAGAGGALHLVLPALTLALGTAGGLSRLTRAGMLEELHQPYVRTAGAKGLPSSAVVLGHCLRNALIALSTVVTLRLGQLLGGAVIVETVFAWPGIGTFVVDAIYDRDYPVIQGFVLFTGTVFLALALLADVLHARLDPRVALDEGGRRVPA